MNLKPLAKDEIVLSIKNTIENDSWQLSIILISGDILVGDFFPEWQLESKENINSIWIPKVHEKHPKGHRFGLVFDKAIKIVFNSPKGTVHGEASVIDVPLEKIADIKKLNWENADINKNGLKNISNPMASIINKQNSRVAKSNHLTINLYVEMALAHENISNEGIVFENDELIYIDIDFFNNSQWGNVSLGLISLGGTTGAYQIAKAKLCDSVLQKTLRAISGSSMEPLNILGFLQLLKGEMTTELEGFECFIILCKSDDELLPLIIKKKSLCYPLEYMNFIKSKLMFYGEIKQIPIKIEKDNYPRVLFARAIGFIKNKCT